MIYLYCSKDGRCFIPIMETIAQILTKYSIKYQWLNGTEEIKEGDVFFCIWNGVPSLPNCLRIVYNFDPFVKVISDDFAKYSLSNRDLLIDYCYGKNNISKVVVPYGFTEIHQRNFPTQVDENIDILFYGNISQRRYAVIKDIWQYCYGKGYSFVCRQNDLYDEKEKTELIARSKIILSIASADALFYKTNDLVRLSFCISNKKFVIAERIGDTKVENMLEGVEYIDTSPNDTEVAMCFCEKISYYLENPEKRKEKATLASENFKTNFPFEKNIISIISPKINYVISSHGEISEKYLNQLYNLLQKGTSAIKYITVVHENKSYSNQNEWTDKFNSLDIQIDFIAYKGENKYHFYDYWIQGMLTRKGNADYHIFVQEDYYPILVNFERVLANLYLDKFQNNRGYLCSLVNFNGIISDKTFGDNILEQLYSTTTYPQLAYSKVISDQGVEIKEYIDKFSSPFWNSSTNSVVNYGKGDSLFVPVQLFTS